MFLPAAARADTETAAPTTSAAAYPPPTPCATSVLDGTFKPDSTLKIESTGFTPNGRAQIWLHSTPVLLLNTAADATGTIVASVHIPADLAPGTHTLEITMPNRTCTLALHSGSNGTDATATNRVQPNPTLGVDATTTTNSSSLAFTGASTLTSLVIVVVLLAGGTIFLVLGRRRRT